MAAAEAWWDGVLPATLALLLAAALVLLLRPAARRMGGAAPAHTLWALLPLAVLATIAARMWPGWAPDWSTPTAPVQLSLDTDAVAVPALPGTTRFDWRPPLFALWLVGTIVVLLRAAGQQHRLSRSLVPDPDGCWNSALEPGPALVGLWRPRIVLPVDFRLRFDAQEQRLVLAHEQMHRRRCDPCWQAIALLLQAAFWFLPGFAWVLKRHRLDQELACDAAVLAAHPSARRVYANALLKSSSANPWLPIGCHWQSRHPLLERIAMLKKHHHPTLLRPRPAALLAAALLALASWTGFAVQSGAAPAVAAEVQTATAQLLYSAQLYRNGERVSAPRLVGRVGQPVSVRIDAAKAAGGTDTSRSWTLELEGQPGSNGYTLAVGVRRQPDPAALELEGTAGDVQVLTTDQHDGQHRLTLQTSGRLRLDYRGADAERFRVELDVRVLPPGFDPSGVLPQRMDPPRYPPAALEQRQQGKVLTELQIDASGWVTAARVVSAEPPGVFDAEALAAVRGWLFSPALDPNGEPVASTVRVPVNFQLDPPAAASP